MQLAQQMASIRDLILSSTNFVSQNAKQVSINQSRLKEVAEWIVSYHSAIRSGHKNNDIAEEYTQKSILPATWHSHKLHPDIDELGPRECVEWIFFMDLLNFSFFDDWRERISFDDKMGFSMLLPRYSVEYCGEKYTGYWTLNAAIKREKDSGIPVYLPEVYHSVSLEQFEHFFRGEPGSSRCPMIEQRWKECRKAGNILKQLYDKNGAHRWGFWDFLEDCEKKYLSLKADEREDPMQFLLSKLAETFDSFRDWVDLDETERLKGNLLASEAQIRKEIPNDTSICFFKRAQILIADLWSCFRFQTGEKPGMIKLIDDHGTPLSLCETNKIADNSSQKSFASIDIAPPGIHSLTMFADYRVPQCLVWLGLLEYKPELYSFLLYQNKEPIKDFPKISSKDLASTKEYLLPPGHTWELEIRAQSIQVTEMLLHEINRKISEISKGYTDNKWARLSAIELDFFLWDWCKELALVENKSTEELKCKKALKDIPIHKTRSIFY